jgi:hypothetical protein
MDDLEKKQMKAQELRQSALDVKTEQWKSKAGKVLLIADFFRLKQ